MPGRVFVTRELPPGAMALLRKSPHVESLRVNPYDRPVTRAELLEGVAQADCLLSQLVDRIDAEVLAANPALRLVANYAVGFNNVDVQAASAAGVPVSNTPGVLTECTADFTWGLLLAVARRVVEGDRCLRAGRYPGWSPQFMLGTEVHGKTLGIVGLGRIGAAVARRARGFGMRLLYASPRAKLVAAELGASHVPLERLLAESDFVSLHVYADASTRRLIDATRLRQMKPTAFLINAARGEVVDEAALVEALRLGVIAGAGLDVFEREPDLAPGLAELPNAVLAPHLGSATHETREAMGRIAAENVLDVLAGRPPRTCVNPDTLG
jgi:glyoxylate reductase